jgi:hypothetical protein
VNNLRNIGCIISIVILFAISALAIAFIIIDYLFDKNIWI